MGIKEESVREEDTSESIESISEAKKRTKRDNKHSKPTTMKAVRNVNKTVSVNKGAKSLVAKKSVRPTKVFAQQQKEKLNFKGTLNSNLGFTEKDSAGQSNIFAVEPSVYMQSKSDGASSAATLLTVLGVGAGFGLVASLLLLKQEAPVDSDLTYLFDSGKTLSSYEQKFTPPKPAIVKSITAVVEAAAPSVSEAPVEEASAPIEEASAPIEEATEAPSLTE